MTARSGLRLLTLGLVTLVAEYAVLVAALVVLGGLSGPDPAILVAAGAIDLALVALRTGLKWFGYRRCEPAADEFQSAGWLTAARYAAVVRAAGYAGMVVPLLLGVHPNESGSAGAVAAVGQVAWMLGTVAEFTVLLAWFRLLGELGGPNAARRVTVYAVTFAFAVLTVAAGVCLATLLTAAARGHARLGAAARPRRRAAGGVVRPRRGGRAGHRVRGRPRLAVLPHPHRDPLRPDPDLTFRSQSWPTTATHAGLFALCSTVSRPLGMRQCP